jgi:hypothetical protein
MTDQRQKQPTSDEAPQAAPKDAAVLAPPRQRAMPAPSHLEPKKSPRRVVHGHSVVAKVPTHHRCEPLALFGNGFVQPMWFANPFSYDFFIHYHLAGLTGAQEQRP